MSGPGMRGSSGWVRGRPGQGRFHGVLAVFLVMVVTFSVLPFGSNRPFYWALWTTLLGAASLLHALALLANRSDYRVRPSAIMPLVVPYSLICLVLVLQLAPLGWLYWGQGIATLTGSRLFPPSVSSTPGETVLMLIRWIGYGLMFFLTLQVARNDNRRLKLLQYLALAISAHAVLGILQFYQWGNTILGFPKWAYLDSMSGTFVNRNSFATLLAIGLTLTTGLMVQKLLTQRGQKRWTDMAFQALCLVFLVGALLGTNSRMGLLVGIAGPLATVSCFLLATKARRRTFMVLVPMIVVVVLASSLYASGVWTRFFELEASGRVRAELYSQVWHMILQAPWLGFGGGSFGEVYQVFHRPPVSAELTWDHAHNTYLALWSELGLVAGMLPLLLVVMVTVQVVRVMRRSDSVDPALPIWLGVVVIAGLHSLVDFSFEMFAIALVFTMLAAIASAASLPARRLRNSAAQAVPNPALVNWRTYS